MPQNQESGIEVLMGRDSKIKAENIKNAIKEGLIASIEIILKKNN